MAGKQDTAEQPTPLSINQTTTAGGIRVLVLSGEVDFDTVDLLRGALQVDDSGPVRFALDLSAVTFMDSSTISVLAAAHGNAVSASGWIRLAAMSHPVQRVVRLVGLDTVLACYPTLAQALAS